jgi:hypothetical protein
LPNHHSLPKDIATSAYFLCRAPLENVIFGGAMTPLLLLFAAAVSSLPWVEDDYGKALADAKAHHVPLFVEVWAPW